MNALKPGRTDERQATVVEGEIRDFIRRDVVPARKSADDAGSEIASDSINSLIDRAARSSVKEIDKLIVDLQNVRDYLRTEGERVQREITRYVQVSQTAMASVKIITDSMGQWKAGPAGGVARPERERSEIGGR
jgi:hypothetical protein